MGLWDRTLLKNYLRAGVLVGLLALGETLPSSISLRVLRVTAWLLIVLGVSGLANGQGALPAAGCSGVFVHMFSVALVHALLTHACHCRRSEGGLQMLCGSCSKRSSGQTSICNCLAPENFCSRH